MPVVKALIQKNRRYFFLSFIPKYDGWKIGLSIHIL